VDGSRSVEIDSGEVPNSTLQAERTQLVRSCARLTGDLNAAEDLAQAALLAGWRQVEQLRDSSERARWLQDIAQSLPPLATEAPL